MTSQQQPILAIKGLLPGVDRRKIQEPYVLEGRNFHMAVDGPESGLGRRYVGYETIANPTNIQSFDVVETHESYICTNEGIFRADTESEKLIPLYLLASDVTSEFPWSYAAVGNKVYFTRQSAGLIEYDITNDSWELISGGSIPTDIYACAESEGRLILLTAAVSAWSAIGDGQDFTPSTTTGAGSQVLTKLGLANPRPLGVQKTADGYLTFLSSGIMKSKAIQAANPFQHRVLSTEHKVINPYSIALLDSKRIVFATLAGLFETAGDTPRLFQPLMSEYMHEKVFPLLDVINNQNNLRLYTNFNRAWFIVSVAVNQQDYVYEIAYLLNTRTDAWGSLNDSHVTFLDFKTLKTDQAGFNFSLITSDGSVARFDSSAGIEYIPPLESGLFYYRTWVDVPARINDDVMYFPTYMRIRTVSTSTAAQTGLYDRFDEIAEYLSPAARVIEEKAAEAVGAVEDLSWPADEFLDFGLITASAGTLLNYGFITDSATVFIDYATVDGFLFKLNTDMLLGLIDIATRQQATLLGSLNSEVLINSVRLSDELTNDRLTFVTAAAINMLEDAVGSIYDDWASALTYPVDLFEDWLTGDEIFEDWGGDPALASSYETTIESSLDAYTPDESQDSTLSLVTSEGRVKFYSCYTTGLYHNLRIGAPAIGDNYSVKTVDMTINLGGRL